MGDTPGISPVVADRSVVAWLDGGGKSPSEQAVKVRLRELLGRP